MPLVYGIIGTCTLYLLLNVVYGDMAILVHTELAINSCVRGHHFGFQLRVTVKTEIQVCLQVMILSLLARN